MYLLCSEIVTVMINWKQDFLSSNSVRNHARDWQIGPPLRDRLILLIARKMQYLAWKLHFVWITFSSLFSSDFDI